MLISGWKNRIMTTCMGLLILICLLTLIHWGVKAITVKIPRLYNYSLIKMALASTPPEKNGKNPDKNIHIDWAKRYPFDNIKKILTRKYIIFLNHIVELLLTGWKTGLKIISLFTIR